MLKNYFVITIRNFVRNKNYTFINIFGLSIGVTCCIVLFLLITHELSFDKHHSNNDQIYRVVHDATNSSGVDYSGVTPYPFAGGFRNDFPDVPLVTQYHDQQEALISIGADKHLIDNVIFGDSLFFSVFDFKVLSGNPREELGTPGKVFLTKSLAQLVNKDNKETTLRLGNLIDLEIVGIIADPPPNSSIQFSMIVSMPSLTKDFIGFDLEQWGLNSAGYSYIVLPSDKSVEQVNERFKGFVEKYYVGRSERKQVYHLQPLAEVHFDPLYNDAAANKVNLFILGLLGMFILSIACINFINLATALAVRKSKEIGVRKTLGAKRSQLTMYFLGETLFITLFSVLVSLGVVEWLLPWLNRFLEKELTQSLFTNPPLILFLVILTFVVTVLSGLYPALILSGYNPISVLKNKNMQGGSGATMRKVLVAFQFLIAQALIIGTLVVSDQMNFFRTKPLGFDKEFVINVDMPDNKPELHQSFRERLLTDPDIETVTFSVGAPVSDSGIGTGFFLAEKGQDQSFDVNVKVADHHYLQTYGLQLIAGRWIEEGEEKLAGPPLPFEERKYVFVINESAAKTLGFSDPKDAIGKNVSVGLNDIVAEVVGVVKDFHTSSMHDKISPVLIMNFPHFYYDAGIRITSGNMQEKLAFIERTWNDLHPNYFYRYTFLDQKIATLYKKEEQTFMLFKIFAGISIFIGCLGLYGLISFMANQKLKEVGIRKVLGASPGSIVFLFSKEFIKLILIAFIIAAPLSWYAMNSWLQNFSYRIDIHWSVFAIGIVTTLVIALSTVSYRAVRAASLNPVKALKDE